MDEQYLSLKNGHYKPAIKVVLSCLFFFMALTSVYGQAAYYTFTQDNANYNELDNPTVIIENPAASGTTSLDEQVYTLNDVIPFPFEFAGVTQTSIKVHVNGFISFGATTSTTSDPISSSSAYAGVISPLAADFNTLYNIAGKTGNISYQVIGTAPNREFVVQWSHFKPYYSSATPTSHHDWNFQAILSEDGTIHFSYNLLSVGTPSATNAKVGLRGLTNTDYINRTASGNANSNWSNTTAGTLNSSGIATNYSFLPTPGLKFTWVPPSECEQPPAQPTGLTLTNTGIIINGSFTAAQGADRYLILRNLAGTTPNAPVNGTVYTTGNNADLNSYVAYYGTNTTFENNYNNGIRGNNEYEYTIYSVSSNCTGGPIYLTESPLTANVTNCPATVNSITAGSVTSDSFTLNWPATENGEALPFNTIIEVATNNTFTSMVEGSPFTLESNEYSLPLTGLDANTQYFWRGKNATEECESSFSSIGNIYTACVAVTEFSENFDSITGLALPNCWGKIIASNNSSTPTINNTTTDSASQPNNVSFYGNGADTDNAATKIIMVSPQVTNLAAGTHRLRFKARKTSTTTSPSATSLRIVALDGNTVNATVTEVADFPNLTSAYQEYIAYFNDYTGDGNYIGIQRYGGPSYSYLYVDDIVWEQIPTCPELATVTAASITPSGATISWTNANNDAPAGGYEYFVSTSATAPGNNAVFTQTNNTSAVLTGLPAGTTHYVFVRRICADDDKSPLKSVSFTTVVVAPAPWQEEFLTSTAPAGWAYSAFTLGSVRGVTGSGSTPRNLYKNMFSASTNTGTITTIPVGPLNAANYELSFYYKQAAYDPDYAPLANWGSFTVEVSTDFGQNYTVIGTVDNEQGTGGYIKKTYPLTNYNGEYVKVRIVATRTAGDFDLSFDNFEIRQSGNLGIGDFEKQAVTLYPNPATDVINIQAQADIDSVKVYNSLGQQVLTANTETINVSNLPGGIYIVEVQFADKTVTTQKIIKK